MHRKRIKRHNDKPIKDAQPVADPELVRLAAVLEQIAAMDTLPQVPSHRSRKRKPCAT
jgi:hypothetical protein